MARSTRPSRRSSRKPSPAARNTKKSSKTPTESAEPEKKKTLLDHWVEPPLRAAPSFEDHKGGQRVGVLHDMQPLGATPNARLRAKAKPEPFRRLKKGINTEDTDVSSGPAAQETAASGEVQGADSGNTTEHNSDASSSNNAQNQIQAQEEPATVTATASTSSSVESSAQPSALAQPAAPTQPSAPAQVSQVAQVTQPTHAAPDRAKMKTVVDAAVSHASASMHAQTGLAIQKMYRESRHRPDLLEILDAVLSHRATDAQATAFRAYINSVRPARRARRPQESGDQSTLVAGDQNNLRSSAASSPQNSPTSPIKKLLRPTRNRNKVINNTIDNESPSPHTMENDQIHSARSSRSGSTSSSLSSVKSLVDDQEFAPPAAATNGTNASHPQPEHAPGSNMTTSSGPQLHNFSTTKPSSSINNIQKRTSSAAGLGDEAEQDRVPAVKRQKVAQTFDHVPIPESGIRYGLSLQEAPTVRGSASTESIASPTPNTQTPSNHPNGLKRPAPDDDDDHIILPGGGAADLRASTSVTTRRASRADNSVNAQERPAKRAKTARIKMSPVKNKKGVIAGVGRSSTTPVGYEGMSDGRGDNNNDYCSACGGGGTVVCCDGCPRSFHAACLDPPVDQNNLPEPWFCFDCTAKRTSQVQNRAGIFENLFGNLDKKNPVAYNMPPEIRGYFEHVETGKDGEFVDGLRQSKTRSATVENVDARDGIRDSKGQLKLCFKCGKSTIDGQTLVHCDYCPLYWHLDCVDPPIPHLAPRKGTEIGDWMCPVHVEHDLEGTDPSYRQYARNIVGNNDYSTRTTKVRTPKQAKLLNVGLKGDSRNRGLIEIENDPTDDETSDFYEKECGAKLQIPERRLKFEFIERVHRRRREEAENQEIYSLARARAEKAQRKQSRFEARLANRRAAAPNGDKDSDGDTSVDEAVVNATTEDDSTLTQIDPRDDFYKRSLIDQQAALNLAQFAQSNNDINLGRDEIENLLNTLIAEASPEVVAMMTASEKQVPSGTKAPVQKKSGMSEGERASLLMLQELIRRRLDMCPSGVTA